MAGWDQIFLDYERDGLMLVLGWDNWSGCFIDARTEAADSVVLRIGEYINQLLADL